MASKVRIFGADTIDRLSWPADEGGRHARKYLVPLIKNGPLSYVENANVRMMALAVDGFVMPLVVSGEIPGNSDVCSLYSHYVSYTLEEMAKRNNPLSQRLLKPLVLAIAVFLRAAHLDKVVYVNNWLFTTNPGLKLMSGQVREITTYLVESYPDHAIVFRSVNRHTDRHFFGVLRENKYRMVAGRKVYMLDPSSKTYRKNKNVRRDRNLLKTNGYKIIESKDLGEQDIMRITRLYRDLYLKKHSRLNPQFNAKFISLMLRENIWAFKGLKKNGRIDSFASYYSMDGVMTGTLLGYDLDLPQKLGLYRQALAILTTEASNREEILNLSGGAGSFKLFRGAVPCIEYEAIYDHNLPYHRRLAYFLVSAAGVFQHFN